jgi:WD40 repeat protein
VSIKQVNQNQVATGSSDNTVKIWDITTKTLINTYNGHTAGINSLVVLPSGLLVSSAGDSTIRVWNTEAQTVSSFNTTTGVNCMRFNPFKSPNGLLAFGMYARFEFYDPITFTLTKTVHTSISYFGLDILQTNGNMIAGGAALAIFSINGSILFYRYNTATIISIKILPDNVTVVMGQTDSNLTLFNLNNNSLGDSVLAHPGSYVYMLELTPDLVYLISGARDSKLNVWSWSTMSLTKVNEFAVINQVFSGAVMQSVYTGKFCLGFIL